MPRPHHRPLILSFLLCACSSRPLADSASSATDALDTTAAAGPDTTGTTADLEPTSAAATTTGMSPGTGTTVPEDSTSAAATSCGFICPQDAGPPGDDCDPYAQDCPEGQKCSQEGGLFDDTQCVPVVRGPKKVGEPCSVVPEPPWNHDDCELGALCWDIDPDTNTGTCHALCVGSPDAPTCEDPVKQCWPFCQSCVLQICIAPCDPLAQDCGEGSACIPETGPGGGFICALDASGDEGQYADPCEYANACDPGLFCGDSEFVPGCEPNAFACCTPFCDVQAPACPDADLGAECVSWYEEGQAPPGLEHIGVCGLPP